VASKYDNKTTGFSGIIPVITSDKQSSNSVNVFAYDSGSIITDGEGKDKSGSTTHIHI